MVLLPNMFKATSPATESLRVGRFFSHSSCSNVRNQRRLSAVRWSDLLCPLFSSPQYGQLLRLYQQPDRSCLPRHTADQSLFFEFQNHLVNRGRRRLKVSFQVSFGWCATVHLRVVVDKRKVLPLFLRKSHFHLMIHLFGTTICITCAGNHQTRKSDAANQRQVDAVVRRFLHLNFFPFFFASSII